MHIDSPVILSYSQEERFTCANKMVVAQLRSSLRKPAEVWGNLWVNDSSNHQTWVVLTTSVIRMNLATWRLEGEYVMVMHREVFVLMTAHLVQLTEGQTMMYSEPS
jgi:hypothetical protein